MKCSKCSSLCRCHSDYPNRTMTTFTKNFREIIRRDEAPMLYDGMPTQQLLFSNYPLELTENKVIGSYNNVSDYVRVHYDLLLADFMCPLRESLNNFMNKGQTRDFKGARIYFEVGLKEIDKNDRTCKLNIADRVKLNREDHLTFGKLLVFTPMRKPQKFHKKFFPLKEIRQNFRNRFFVAMITSDTTDGSKDIELEWCIPKKSYLTVTDLFRGPFFVMEAEAFYFVYRNVLGVLGNLSEKTFPMAEYIVYGTNQTKVSLPTYLTESTLYSILGHKNVPVLNSSKWPSHENLGLNRSQCIALQTALTQEIALIQGPPGTGKTFFGVKLVQVLLDNVKVWNSQASSPLFVICQSNLAVDNFLEGVLKHTDKIVRVGSRSQSRKLKPFSLKELGCRWVVNTYPDSYRRDIGDTVQQLDKARRQLQELSNGIVSFKTLSTSLKLYSVFTSEEQFLEWLGLHIKAEKKCVPEENTDLIISICELTQHIYQFKSSGEHKLANDLNEDLTKTKNLVARFFANDLEKDLTKIEKLCEMLRLEEKESKAIPNKKKKEKKILNFDDILSLSPDDAGEVYACLLRKFSTHLENEIKYLEDNFRTIWKEHLTAELKESATLAVLGSAQVVGLTSTGAVIRRHILQQMRIPIVIMDEAAELLESHVIAALTKSCNHLILLGDHKQLKPSLTTHDLKKFHLDLSLFERLLINKVLTGTCLTTQYRMRPEFSALLKPHIYEVLEDGPETMERAPVRGISKNLYFLNHKKLEVKTRDQTGIWNPHEVEMLIKLAEYFVYKGYPPKDITIISMYSEQKKQLIRARDEKGYLTDMQIASVDGFQGMENEIILLSLVRSNSTGNIGFLSQENRACVALSRARSGFFIMGNMKCLKKRGKIWEKVSEVLEKQNAIGMKLPLVCDDHKTAHMVSEVTDWRFDFCSLCTSKEMKKKTKDSKKKVPKPKKTAVGKRTKVSLKVKEILLLEPKSPKETTLKKPVKVSREVTKKPGKNRPRKTKGGRKTAFAEPSVQKLEERVSGSSDLSPSLSPLLRPSSAEENVCSSFSSICDLFSQLNMKD